MDRGAAPTQPHGPGLVPAARTGGASPPSLPAAPPASAGGPGSAPGAAGLIAPPAIGGTAGAPPPVAPGRGGPSAGLSTPASLAAGLPASGLLAPAGAAVSPGTPAAQLAPALVAMGRGPAGSHRLNLHLAPPDLGRVEIRMDRTADGPARIVVSAQRPETLHLLVRDQAGLHRALDQAGVPAQGRSLNFQLGSGDGGNRNGGFAFRPGAPTSGFTDPATFTAAPSPPPPRFARAGLDITA